MKYIFAGDRDIAVWVLQDLIDAGYEPMALLVSGDDRATHSQELISTSKLPDDKIYRGKEFTKEQNLDVLRSLEPDYIIGIHFPYIIRKNVLDIPSIGFLNLHPAYLPYNRGWHTPSWAIAEGTPVGATLHFMSEALDMGDIIGRKEVKVEVSDTANTLYVKLKQAERELFKSEIPNLVDFNLNRITQNAEKGTSHKAKDLFQSDLRRWDLNNEMKGLELLKRLRAFSTNKIEEGVTFEHEGRTFNIRVEIEEKNEE